MLARSLLPPSETHPGRRRETLLLGVGIAAMIGLGVVVETDDRLWMLRMALQLSPAGLPSTRAISAAEVSRGLPLLSLSVDDPDLRDPSTGILAKPLERGRQWERPASVSFIDRGRLMFGGLAGIRVHGDGTRRSAAPQSYRLYFRRSYGTPYVSPGVLFDGKADPIRSLVVHNDRRIIANVNWHLTNPLAYDIARQVGIHAPYTMPVRLFLNGHLEGLYVLTEHLGPGFFRAHFGHERFFASEADERALFEWARQEPRLTMANVGARVDLDNLTRWSIAYVFCDTLDAFQSPSQFRDQMNAGARWFWIPWDMDQSFRHWDQNSLGRMLATGRGGRPGRFRYDPRSTILLRLLENDRLYRTYFERLWEETLNHRLTPAFLSERAGHYEAVARAQGVTGRTYRRAIREFLERRPAYVRSALERMLKTGPSVELVIHGPRELPMIVDGYPVSGAYTGAYFPGRTVTVQAARHNGPRFSHWLVDGVVHEGRTLTVAMRSDVRIEPVVR